MRIALSLAFTLLLAGCDLPVASEVGGLPQASGSTTWISPIDEPPRASIIRPAPVGSALPVFMPTPGVSAVDLLGMFEEGVRRDLAGANQLAFFRDLHGALTAGQRESLHRLVADAPSTTAGFFLLKALTAGEPWEHLLTYAQAMHGHDDAAIVSRSTMRDPEDLIQQWQDACGPTLLQTVVGEVDPRYAWELNARFAVTLPDPDGRNAELAMQQKEWLEAYGGLAVPRGESGGRGIAITQLLNDKLSPIVSARYDFATVGEVGPALDHVAAILETGYDVPLRLSWEGPGNADDAGHFLVAQTAEGGSGAWRLQIHDPFTGKTAWVSQADLAGGSFGPIFEEGWLTHYYVPTPIR